MTDRDRIEELEAEIANLRATIAELTGDGRYAFPDEWKLRPTEARILSVIADRGMATHEGLYLYLYSDRLDPPGSNSVAVMVSNIRRNAPVKIICKRGIGYSTSQADHRMLARYKVGSGNGR